MRVISGWLLLHPDFMWAGFVAGATMVAVGVAALGRRDRDGASR